ncbi:MAG: xanthine dehydrogenase family protein subunit M [Clostridia bacterium]|jgi:CO/xanthine dehydrogenase FAD-binding subunit|nr:xanthine dehydrogenase family protein subunit M [Clostridia bacterium]
MKQFNYFRPQHIGEAINLLEQLPEVRILAGGTDIVIHLREGKATPQNVVDISGLAELTEIDICENEVSLGSMVTFTQVMEHPLIKEEFACLSDACAAAGSPQIRNQGTIGGNIVNASPAADSVPALVALGARIVIKSARGTEEAKVEDILTGVGRHSLAKNQLLISIKIPRVVDRQISSFTKLARRNALTIARMSMAAVLRLGETGIITRAGISLGAVAPNPFPLTGVEEYLMGKGLTPEVIGTSVEKIAQVVQQKLGERASAVYKNEAIRGIANQTFAKLQVKLEGGRIG